MADPADHGGAEVLIAVGKRPAAVSETAVRVFVRAAWCLHDTVKGQESVQGQPHLSFSFWFCVALADGPGDAKLSSLRPAPFLLHERPRRNRHLAGHGLFPSGHLRRRARTTL